MDDSCADPIEVLQEPRQGLGPDFTRLWSATAASNLSDGIRQAALPLLAASVTRNPAQVAGVLFATQAPWLLFGLTSGAIVDRFDCRRVIGLSHLFRMAVVGLLAVAVLTGNLGILAIYAAAFLLGTAETLFDNAAQVIVPELVDEQHLEVANGRQEMAMQAGQQLVGPLLGASLFTLATPAPLLVDAAALCLAAFLIFRIRTPRSTMTTLKLERTRLRTEIGISLRWLWRHRELRTISLAACVINIAVNANFAIFVLFALDVLRVGEVGFALLLGCLAVGGILGGHLAPRVVGLVGRQRAVVVAIITASVATLVTGGTSNAWLAGAMVGVVAAGGSVWAVVTCSMRQRLAPSGMLGRVTGAHRFLSWGGAAVGAAVGGVVANIAGLRAPFIAGALLLAAVAVVVAVVRIEPAKMARAGATLTG